jgi:class 3 adenylate cyclase
MAVLFLDICNLSKMNSESQAEHERVLRVLNLFIAEMLRVVREYDGEFEKNTGDGLMAYFAGTNEVCTLRAVDAALRMHSLNEQVLP